MMRANKLSAISQAEQSSTVRSQAAAKSLQQHARKHFRSRSCKSLHSSSKSLHSSSKSLLQSEETIAASRVQAHMRARTQRQEFTQMKKSAKVIQARMRGRASRQC